MGLTEEQIDQPFVGVATCWNEAAPCNIALSRQAQAVKKGVAEAGGTPREFTTITVTDGIAMGHAGHEILAGQPRDDRRLGRTDDARPLLRRAGRPRRLRQVAARHDDGDAAAQRAEVFMYGGSILPGKFKAAT
jgi:dihydroxy-acid dehydratase